MNKSDLEQLLKSASAPERPPDFWADLPRRITAKLHWQAQCAEAPQSETRRFPARAWASTALAACLIIAFVLWFSRDHVTPSSNSQSQMAQAGKFLREIEQLFPHQVSAIVFDENGPRLVLAEKADVPDSPPLYLKICGPRGCQQFVTFSGQQIRVNGDDCDVLQDAAGNVLLVGKQIVWSSGSTRRAAVGYRIEAHQMEISS